MISPAPLIARFPFLRKPVREVIRAYVKALKPRYSVEKRMGLTLLLDRISAVDRNLLIEGVWEAKQLALLSRLIDEHSTAGRETVFLDIGAHGAIYSMVLARRADVDRVIAFEPDPVNMVQLKANLFLNGMLNDIALVDKAASDAKGSLAFVPGGATNRGKSRIAGVQDGSASGKITVDAVRIDSMVPLEGTFVVAKIDVEGAEMRVLAGMEQAIARNTCLLQVESFADQVADLTAWMTQHGFVHVGTVDHDYFFLKA